MGVLSEWIRGCGTITEEAAELTSLLRLWLWVLLSPPVSSFLCLVSQSGWWPFTPCTIKPFVLQDLFMMEFLHLKESN